MATSSFSVRCKTRRGVFTLNELVGGSTVEDLKICLAKLTHEKPETMKILCGYPPKALSADCDKFRLSDVKILSGDTVYMESIPEPPVEPDQPEIPVEDEIPLVDLTRMQDQPGIMMRQVVPSNNSCLFTSMHFLLVDGTINEQKSNDLRNIIVSAVKNNPGKYNAAYLGMPNSDYCNWILNTAHWGGAIELAIFSEYFKVEVVAVDTVSLKLHRFGEIRKFKQRVFLIYDGIHYDPLLMEFGDNKQTIFPTDDPKPMEMALEIAKEAKSSRQFTDVANFTVSCKVCHVKLRGDKEARQHAKETGHVQFGEL